MRTNNILGILFANVHDDLVPELTRLRSMASLPIAGRYRMVDFSLSNLVNAGISQVGIITKQNYQSLMDHVGGGKSWDLDRKSGGLFILPPFSTIDSKGEVYKGHLDALQGIMGYLQRAKQDYVVLCDCDVVSNVDIMDMYRKHVDSGADFTVAYKRGKLPKNHEDIMTFTFDENNFVKEISLPKKSESANYSLDITITKREFLIELLSKVPSSYTSISRHLLARHTDKFKIYGYEETGFAEVVDSTKKYFELNMKMLNSKNKNSLFNPARPVYTKTHDGMPTRYGIKSCVKNSLIADGCVIEGKVENCVIFRNVKVEEGATVKDCILMQGATVKQGANVSRVIMDKQSTVENNVNFAAKENDILFVAKREKVEK